MRSHHVLVPTVLVVVVGIALADDSKRAQLKTDIDKLVANIASELRDVPTDSSTSDLDYTVRYAGEIVDKVKSLKNDFNDSALSDYIDIATRYQDAARYLKELKNDHRSVDDLPRKCDEKMRELADRMRRYTDTHDPRGLEEVPRAAREIGRFGKESIAQAEGARRLAQERNDRVAYFSGSADRWNDVRSNLHAAARTLYDHTARMTEQIKRDDVCGNLAKEDRNPLAEQAMQKLLEGKKGIEGMYDALDRMLGETGAHLDGLVGDSDASDIQSAEGKLDAVDRALDQLDRMKGNDGEARRRVETWRTTGRAAREALKQLRTLKLAQFLADNAPAKCRESVARLHEIIRGFTERRNTRGITEIPLRARGIAEPIKTGLAKTDEQHAIMERALADALRFDASEGHWRYVRDQHRTSANAVFEYWKKARQAAHHECDELVKGDQSDMVQRALRDLSTARSAAQDDLARLVDDHTKWNESIRELRGWYKQDTAAVRDMFCKLEESPGDDAVAGAYIAQLEAIANRMRDRLAPKWGAINSAAAELYVAIDRLRQQEDEAIRGRAFAIKGEIEKRLRSLANLMANELNGANDPEFRMFLEVGKNEHKRIQADSSSCAEWEITIPRAGMRMDCVRVSSGTCNIVEIKPNNSSAIAKGRTRAEEYKAAMTSYFEDAKKRNEIEEAFQAKLSIFKQCIDRGALKLEISVRVYDLCPADGRLYNEFAAD